eukprot:10431635-Karenia_brevis.AAC.1
MMLLMMMTIIKMPNLPYSWIQERGVNKCLPDNDDDDDDDGYDDDADDDDVGDDDEAGAVSYTHLTLPTICSV